ncbi:MAG: prolyl oligopeptidase family serine peptidase [Thermomicrobiales bacterium]|nr:prolyl oligopeptidase family serine peptidase [Thermomicrobiales bacterium]
MFAAASEIADGDYDSWFDTFTTLGDRIRGIAETSLAAGDRASARAAFLRASSYYGQAYFFTLGTSAPDRIVPTWETHRACFDRFASLLDLPAEVVEIPYEDTTLPGYALLVDDSGAPRPWLIMNNGSDGTVTDMWSFGAAAALRRGFNALIFDGPGQGAALWRQHLYFRPDWEKVITPVVDWLLTRPDVDPDRLAIMGISQGGYWVPRALAFEHRLAAGIADPGVMNVATSWTAQMPPDTMEGLLETPEEERVKIAAEIDQGVAELMAHNPAARFTLAMRMAPFGFDKLSETLVALAAYNLHDVVGQIRTPLLIADPEGEAFWPGQSQELYDALPGPKELVRFTAAEGADLHCEPKALGLREQRFFDWLNRTLGGVSADATPAP